MKYKRVMLKLSGGFFKGGFNYGIDQKVMREVADEILKIVDLGVEVAIEVGGGNICRGKQVKEGMSRNIGDIIGMLASVMNALNLREAIGDKHQARALSPIFAPYIIQLFTPGKAIHYLEEKKIVILGGGTGVEYFSTDSGAVLHALQTKCDVVLKGTDVDGVYNSDPQKNKNAKKFDKVTYNDAIQRKLDVMDMTAFALARDNSLPIVIFNIKKSGSLERVIKGEKIGTLVC